MDKPDEDISEDDDIARLLRVAGPREQLADDMKQRWEQQFRAELLPVLERRSRGRRRLAWGLCASLAVVTGTAILTLLAPAEPDLQIQVSHASGEALMQRPGKDAQEPLVGLELPAGSQVSTGENGFIAVKYAGYDLRLNHRTRLVLGKDRITLESGEIYASDYAASNLNKQLRIDTIHGVIRDIGTQFTVVSNPDRTITTVRRGAIQINTGDAKLRAEAMAGSASRLTIDRQRQVHSESVDPSGEDWNWIYSGPANFTLEGKTAYDFLKWSVGESGLELAFASERAEIHARTTQLHGDISGLNPEQAVQPVLASTDLVAERTTDNTLRVTLNSRY